ncbi:MAG: SRPBCC family protein [Flavobacteriales bacterium]|nr:SRPBCC family protein [Flavobacteriales bacterium]
MKYQTSIEIDRSREEVVAKFEDPENFKHWQRGFISMEHISGDKGMPGAKSKMKYKMGRRETEMIETIVHNDLPDQFHATFEANGVYNLQENYFTEGGSDKMVWRSVSEFRFSSFTMKVMGWLMPKAFKKQSYKFMVDFKNFVEKGESVAK